MELLKGEETPISSNHNQILTQDMGPFLFLLLTVLKVSLLSFPHSQKSVILGWILLRPEIPS